MITYSPVLLNLAEQFFERLNRYSKLPVKNYGWENYIWTSPYFSWAHLEKFCTEKVSVFHCVVMPIKNSSAPIYGFDVIEMNGKLTGMFLDVTPVDKNKHNMTLPKVGKARPVPDWGDFFSDQFCCCEPNEQDINEGFNALLNYLDFLPYTLESNADYTLPQQQYIEGQRKNPQTYRMLKSFVGEEIATEFINTVLWPDIT